MSRKWRILLAVCFGSYIATMDFSIVNMALPTLAREFDAPPDQVVWVSLTSGLVVTGLTLTAGRGGDLWGRRRVYLTGWIIFSAGLLAAGFAQSLPQLLAIRVVQAVGVSLTMANGNALITSAFPDNERGKALGINGSVVGAGLMSGPILGGLLLTAFDWQGIFLARAPLGAAACLMGWFVLPRDAHQPVAAGRRLDIPGAVALFLTLATGLLAINRGQAWGWTSPVILGSFTVSVASLATFVLVERRSASPVVSLALFRVRAYTTGVSSLVLNFAGQSTTTFLMPFYLIAVRGYSTAHTGLIIATVPSMMLLLSPLSGWLSDRFHFRHQVTIGLVIVTAGLALLATVSAGTPDTLIMARLAVVGIGTSVFMSPNSSQIMGSVPRAMLGTASASVATARNIGTATGLAISGAVLIGVATASAGVASASSVTDLPDDALLDGIKAAFLVASLVSSTAVVASLFRNPVRSTPVALAPLPRPPVGEAAEPGGTSAGS